MCSKLNQISVRPFLLETTDRVSTHTGENMTNLETKLSKLWKTVQYGNTSKELENRNVLCFLTKPGKFYENIINIFQIIINISTNAAKNG